MALSPAAVAMGQHFANFLNQHGYPVAPYTTGVKPYPNPAAGAASAFALPGEVNWTPGYVGLLEDLANRLGTRGRLTPRQLNAARLGLHEGIHQMRYGRSADIYTGDPNTPGTGAYWEEASTEAAARDLLPIFAAKMYGHRLPNNDAVPGSYDGGVTQLRQLSVFGSGGEHYRTRPARVWRRTFNHADAATRQRMIDEAMQARIAWGQRRAAKRRRTPSLLPPGPDRVRR